VIPGNEPFLVLLNWVVVILCRLFVLGPYCNPGLDSRIGVQKTRFIVDCFHKIFARIVVFLITQTSEYKLRTFLPIPKYVCQLQTLPIAWSHLIHLPSFSCRRLLRVYCALCPPVLDLSPFSVVHREGHNPQA
jgi:hypothetical protein